MTLRKIVIVFISVLFIQSNQGQNECKLPVNITCGPNSSDRGTDFGIETRLVTGKQFTCNGTISGWRVAGTVGQGRQYPKLQVWRLRDTTSSSEEYFKPGNDISMEGTVLSPPVDCDIFEHTLDEASQMSVRSGDILGIELPPGTDQAFDILYALGGGPQTYVYRRRLSDAINLTDGLFGRFDVQPLIDLRVTPEETTTEQDIPIISTHPVTTTDSKLITTHLKLPVTTANDDRNQQAIETAYFTSFIAVASLGGVTEISILMIVIVLLVVVVNKNRRAPKREHLLILHKSGDHDYNKHQIKKEQEL